MNALEVPQGGVDGGDRAHGDWSAYAPKTEHRLSEDEAAETAVDLAYRIPKVAYARRERA